MKTSHIPLIIVAVGFAFSTELNAEESPSLMPEPSQEEMAEPPLGKIKRISRRTLTEYHEKLAQLLIALPDGTDGKANPWYAKLVALSDQLETSAASLLQSDVMALVPCIFDALITAHGNLFPRINNGSDPFVSIMWDLTCIINDAVGRYLVEHNAALAPAQVETLALVGMISPGDREGVTPFLITEADCFVVDPVTTVTRMMARPWRDSLRLVSIDVQVFDRYATRIGERVPGCLIAKCNTNKAQIIAKYNELKAWVAQQKAADEATNPPPGGTSP